MKLYGYQNKAIRFLLNRTNTVLALAPGLGKTIISISALKYIKLKNILIVCPASLKINWRKELEDWYPSQKRDIEIISSGKQVVGVKNITIINYELLIKKEIHSQIIAKRYDALILDELHYLKNLKASRTKAIFGSRRPKLQGIFSVCDRVYGLTGTPIPNRPIEMYPWVTAFFPKEFSIGYRSFAKRYCAAWEAPWGFDVSGSSNIFDLKYKLKNNMLRLTKEEVLKDLPTKTNQLVFLEKDRATGLIITREAQYNPSELIQKNSALAFEGLSELRHEMGLAKIPVCTKYITDWLNNNETDKLIIFAHHRDVIALLSEKLKKYECAVINGETPLQKRDEIVTKFQDKKSSLRIIIGNITSIGVGLTLTAAATAMFIEFSWVSGELDQASDRLHRIGQNRPVLIKYLVINGSLDSYMLNKIFDKKKVISSILD